MLLNYSGLAKLKLDGKATASSIIVDAIEQACDDFAKLSDWFVVSSLYWKNVFSVTLSMLWLIGEQRKR